MERLYNFVHNLREKPFIESIINNLNGEVFAVGGIARDLILNKSNKDIDLVVRNVPIDILVSELQKFGKIDLVGKLFGVLKFVDNIDNIDYDIALPRKDKPNGEGGYHGFEIQSDPNMPIESDLSRRDAKMNAMAININTGKFIDPLGGLNDIKNKQISAANSEAFSDDPLRMLRMISFAARFGFNIEPETLKLIQENAERINEIPPERIITEFGKIVERGSPAIGAMLLINSGLFQQIFGKPKKVNSIFGKVKTVPEFIYLLAKDTIENPAEFYLQKFSTEDAKRDRMYKEIKALELAFNNRTNNIIAARAVAYNMYLISPNALNSAILPEIIKEAGQELLSGIYPKTIGELAINGNDLISLGLKGKEIGDMLKSFLLKIYSNKVANNKEDLLSLAKNKKVTQEGVADVYAEKNFGITNPDTEFEKNYQLSQQISQKVKMDEPYGYIDNSPIYKNPKTLDKFESNVRAVGDREGNLYVALLDGRFNHGELAVDMGIADDAYDVYDNLDNYILLHRIGKSNKFGLSDSSASHIYDYDNNPDEEYLDKALQLLYKLKEKNPQYDFFPKYHGDVFENKKITENNTGDGDGLDYGCLMLYLNVPNWNKIISIIKQEDIYERAGYGIEYEPHVTILYGFHDEVNANQVFKAFKENHSLEPIKVEISSISIFETPEFDVVMFDVNSNVLKKLNLVMKKFPHTDTYSEYHPHITIAYVKRGTGEKYIKKFEKNRKLIGNKIIYTSKGHKGKEGGEVLRLSEEEVINEEMKNDTLYSAIVLDDESRKKLIKVFKPMIPENWEIIAHHMTINLGTINPRFKQDLGKKVELTVADYAIDDKVMAVGIEGYPTMNKRPHITIAVNRANGGKPMMSNNLQEWKLVPFKLKLNGVIIEVKK